VDIGLERAGFIHASDIAPLDDEGMESREAEVADIRALVREGQSLVVQVVKDPISSKGARLTTHLSVSARYLVYMPQTRHIGISNRIEDEGERERLRELVEQASAKLAEEGQSGDGGFILRTVAEGVSEEELLRDIPFLYKLWGELEQRIKSRPLPSVIYEDLPLFMRALRDLARPAIALYVGGMGAKGRNFYNDLFCRYGFEDAAETIQELFLSGKKREAEAAIPGAFLEATQLIGDEGFVRDRIAAYRDSGVSRLDVTPVGPDPLGSARAIKALTR